MKIVIAYPHESVLRAFNTHIKRKENEKKISYKHVDIEFCQTGYTDFETAYHLTDVLKVRDMHLLVYAGLANSLNDMMKTGQVLNVINEIPHKYGAQNNEEFSSAYQLNWLDKKAYPHQRGGFINLTNAYFNIFLPLMKTAAISCRTLGGTKKELAQKMENYPIHIESSNGLAVQYTCLHNRVGFYQLRAIEKNYTDNTTNQDLAIENLNKELIRIVDLL